ncbi:hypothetical protein B0H13DRAFT_1856050 [Mycena leptocephala]|nr:hypothetical protein B0H13DRAFT_1856050 [Mycena leptocephala]
MCSEHAEPSAQNSQGSPGISIRIVPWSDDVSGNEYFVRFCSTSPHASSGEQFEALADDIGTDKFHEAYDCELEQEILFLIFSHVLPADNPQQAESASNAGVKSNLWCRYDLAGGTAAHRETDEGYRALFEARLYFCFPGVPRTPAQTIRTIMRQIWVACSGVQDTVDELQTSTGVKDETALFWIDQLIFKAREMQKERLSKDPRLKDKNLKGDARKAFKTRIKDLIQWELYNWVILQPEARSSKLPKDSPERRKLRQGGHYNMLLSVRGLDPHLDSPCENFHSILLGEDKYVWHETNSAWDKTKGDKFAVRLQSSSTDGLNMSSLRGLYIVKYKNALIGKHFKVLQQLGAFHLHEDLCGKNLFDLWKASGELGALLWYPEIRNQEQYLRDFQVCIDNVLDLWGLIDPARIMTKYKLHVLPHLPDDAPSHDIGVTLADMGRFKHQASGSWWKPAGSQDYIQAGHEIIAFLHRNKELQRRLGWMDKIKPKPGSIKLQLRRKAVSGPWRGVLVPFWSPELEAQGEGKNWTTCKYVVSRVGDICKEQSWIFFKCKVWSQGTETILTGRIFNILIPVNASTKHDEARVIMREFIVSKTRDNRMNMPVLSPSPQIYSVEPADILFLYNAQHDCYGSKCLSVAGAEKIVQERHITNQAQTAIRHVDTDIYFINLHGLHNPHLLRDTLPRNLMAPTHYFSDREQKHKDFAALIRVSGPAKRAAAAKKSKETGEKNKQAKAAREKAQIEETEDSEEPEDMEE